MKSAIALKNNTLLELISALYILLFVYTGVNKFIAMEGLYEVLPKYPLIGDFYVLVAWGLPSLEILLALLLVFPKTKLIGLYGGTVLMLLFTFYVAYLMMFATHMPCTCGGMLQKLSWPQHLAFNIFYVVLGLIAIRILKKNRLSMNNTNSYSVQV